MSDFRELGVIDFTPASNISIPEANIYDMQLASVLLNCVKDAIETENKLKDMFQFVKLQAQPMMQENGLYQWLVGGRVIDAEYQFQPKEDITKLSEDITYIVLNTIKDDPTDINLDETVAKKIEEKLLDWWQKENT